VTFSYATKFVGVASVLLPRTQSDILLGLAAEWEGQPAVSATLRFARAPQRDARVDVRGDRRLAPTLSFAALPLCGPSDMARDLEHEVAAAPLRASWHSPASLTPQHFRRSRLSDLRLEAPDPGEIGLLSAWAHAHATPALAPPPHKKRSR
jgi:hypothetical protein